MKVDKLVRVNLFEFITQNLHTIVVYESSQQGLCCESTVETIVKPLIVIMVIEKHDKLICNNFLKKVNILHIHYSSCINFDATNTSQCIDT